MKKRKELEEGEVIMEEEICYEEEKEKRKQ